MHSSPLLSLPPQLTTAESVHQQMQPMAGMFDISAKLKESWRAQKRPPPSDILPGAPPASEARTVPVTLLQARPVGAPQRAGDPPVITTMETVVPAPAPPDNSLVTQLHAEFMRVINQPDVEYDRITAEITFRSSESLAKREEEVLRAFVELENRRAAAAKASPTVPTPPVVPVVPAPPAPPVVPAPPAP